MKRLLWIAALPLAVAAAPPPITAVSHIAVYSADRAKSEAFYVHDLGGIKRDDPENKNGVRYYFNATQFVEVLPLPADAGKNRLDHVAFATPDVGALRRYLAANGVAGSRVTRGADGSRWFAVNDPEGNRVEFVQAPSVPEAVPANPMSGHIIHVGFIVHDRAKEDAFYLKLLGFRPYWFGGAQGRATAWISSQVPGGTDWLEYMVQEGPPDRGIPDAMNQATAGVLNHFSFGVADIRETVTRLTREGRITGKNDGPKIGRDGKWQFNLYDPDGTRAEIMEFHAVTPPCCSPFTASDPEK
ncbi:MAG: VOC family protein [Rhizomicrobium sp.]